MVCAPMCCSLSTESNHFGCPLGGLVEGRVRVLKRINFLGFKKHRWLEWRRQKTTNFSEGRVLRNTPLPNKNLTSTTQKTPVAVYHKHTGNIDPIQQSWQRYKELSVQFVLGSRNKNIFSRSQENICFKQYLNLLVKGRSKKQHLRNLCFCQVVSGWAA